MPTHRSFHVHSVARFRIIKRNLAATAATLTAGHAQWLPALVAVIAHFFEPHAVSSVGPGQIAVTLPCRAMSGATSNDS